MLRNWRIKRLKRKLAIGSIEQGALQRTLFLSPGELVANLYLASSKRNSRWRRQLHRLEKKNKNGDMK